MGSIMIGVGFLARLFLRLLTLTYLQGAFAEFPGCLRPGLGHLRRSASPFWLCLLSLSNLERSLAELRGVGCCGLGMARIIHRCGSYRVSLLCRGRGARRYIWRLLAASIALVNPF